MDLVQNDSNRNCNHSQLRINIKSHIIILMKKHECQFYQYNLSLFFDPNFTLLICLLKDKDPLDSYIKLINNCFCMLLVLLIENNLRIKSSLSLPYSSFMALSIWNVFCILSNLVYNST